MAKPNNTERYRAKENYVHDYGLEFRKAHYYHSLVKEYHDILGDSILHIGCNSGSTSALLAEYHKSIVGMDINPDAINKAKKDYDAIENIAFICGNIVEPVKFDETFTGIYMLDIIEHIFPIDMFATLVNVEKSLKPGGHVLIFTPRMDPDDPVAMQTAYDQDGTHVQMFRDEIDIVQPLEEHFDVIECVNDKVKNLDPRLALGRHNSWRVLCQKR